MLLKKEYLFGTLLLNFGLLLGIILGRKFSMVAPDQSDNGLFVLDGRTYKYNDFNYDGRLIISQLENEIYTKKNLIYKKIATSIILKKNNGKTGYLGDFDELKGKISITKSELEKFSSKVREKNPEFKITPEIKEGIKDRILNRKIQKMYTETLASLDSNRFRVLSPFYKPPTIDFPETTFIINPEANKIIIGIFNFMKRNDRESFRKIFNYVLKEKKVGFRPFILRRGEEKYQNHFLSIYCNILEKNNVPLFKEVFEHGDFDKLIKLDNCQDTESAIRYYDKLDKLRNNLALYDLPLFFVNNKMVHYHFDTFENDILKALK